MGALLKKEHVIGKGLYSLFMFFIGLLMIFPFLFMISVSFKFSGFEFEHPLQLIPDKINLHNYEVIFHHKYYFTWYWNSVRVVFLQIVFRFFVVTIAAYAFARLDFYGKNAFFLLLMSTIMIPSDTTVVARFLLYKYLHLVNTQWALIVPAAFEVTFLFLLRQFFMGIPKELTESAVMDGCHHIMIYFRIILPLTKPALVTMVLFSFIWGWNDFVGPFIFLTDIHKQLITVGLQTFADEAGPNYPLQMAGATIVTIVPLLLFSIAQRYFVAGVTMSGIKG